MVDSFRAKPNLPGQDMIAFAITIDMEYLFFSHSWRLLTLQVVSCFDSFIAWPVAAPCFAIDTVLSPKLL